MWFPIGGGVVRSVTGRVKNSTRGNFWKMVSLMCLYVWNRICFLLWKLIEFWMEEIIEWDLLGSLVLFLEYTEEGDEIRETWKKIFSTPAWKCVFFYACWAGAKWPISDVFAFSTFLPREKDFTRMRIRIIFYFPPKETGVWRYPMVWRCSCSTNRHRLCGF